MKLPEIAIRRHVLTWMMMGALLLFGGLAYFGLGISRLPDVDLPMVNIDVRLEGAAPGVIETQVVDPLESAVLSVDGIKSISSSAKNEEASVTVEFDLDKDIDVAVQEVQTRLARAQRFLPDQIEPPVVSKINPEDRPILWLAVTSASHSTRDLMEYVRDRLKDRFATATGVGQIFLGGYVEPNLRVWVSGEKLSRYYLTVDDVIDAIRSEHNESPAGQLELPEREMGVRILGEAESVKEFEDIRIARRGGAPSAMPIRLGDVARIEDGLDDIRRISRSDGVPAVGMGIVKQRGANAVAVGDAVKERVEEIRKSLPDGMEIKVNNDSTEFIRESVDELVFTLGLSALLTSLICWLFLGNFSSTLSIAITIPTSIVGSFMILKVFGFTLNTFTLLGLTLAIGIVVDDAIMVLENIVRHREEGDGPFEGALKGSLQITFAAVAATVAIIAIFLPVAFMTGLIGRYFFEFGVTITAAVAFSLLAALTLTPMWCSRFMKSVERRGWVARASDRAFTRIEGLYARALGSVMAHPWITIFASTAIFAGSLGIFRLVDKEFVPSMDQSMFLVRMKTPEGSSLDLTDKMVKEAEKIVGRHPEIERRYVAVGGFGGGESNTAMMFVTMKPKGERPRDSSVGRELTQQEFMDRLRGELKAVKGIRPFLQDLSSAGLGGRRGFPVEFTVRGPDWPRLIELSEKIVDEMEKSGKFSDINSDYVAGTPEVRIIPDREKASEHGVSVADIGRTLQATVGGVVAGQYTRGGKRYDVRVKLEAGELKGPERIRKLFVRNNRGELIRLEEVVRAEERPGPQRISRLDRERAIGISSNVAGGSSQEKALEEARAIAARLLPEGYRIEESGTSKTYRESFQSLLFALLLGIIVSYMVLASQFNSFVHPVTVLVALPFSVTGAILALWIGGQSLNIFSMIGLILLMGIVKKNSILLVEFANQVAEDGRGARAAMEKAGPIRLRPIVMTSVSTIAAAVPPALSLGPGAESQVPMAVAVIGGVVFSTLLTLFVVPSVYVLLDRLRSRS